MKRRWQNLHTNSHFGRILRRKSDRRSSLSIRITANIFTDFLLSLFPHQFRVSLADRPFFVLGQRIEFACVDDSYFDEIKQSTVLLCWGFLLSHKRSVSDAVLSRGLILSVVAAVSLESWNKKANKINFYSSGGNETKASSTQIDSRAKLSHEVTLQWSLFPDKTGVLLFTPRSNEKCWRQIASRLKQIFYGLNWNNDRIQKRFNCDWGLYVSNVWFELYAKKSSYRNRIILRIWTQNLVCKIYKFLSKTIHTLSVLQVLTKCNNEVHSTNPQYSNNCLISLSSLRHQPRFWR